MTHAPVIRALFFGGPVPVTVLRNVVGSIAIVEARGVGLMAMADDYCYLTASGMHAALTAGLAGEKERAAYQRDQLAQASGMAPARFVQTRPDPAMRSEWNVP